MSNAVVTIGNTTPDEFADWLDSMYDGLSMSITPSIGYWNGIRENSITVTIFDRTPHFAELLLAEYGKEHPEEEAFGILDSTFSRLFVNPSNAIPDNVPEDWS